MPTRKLDTNPFAPRGPLSRKELLAYAEGRLDAARQRVVEEHIEADALVRDAVEGMRMPGAAEGLRQLDVIRPRARSASRWWWAGGIAVIALFLAWFLWPAQVEEMSGAGNTAADQSSDAAAPMEPLRTEDIAAATEQPESLRIGHEAGALHRQPLESAPNHAPVGPVVRDAGIEPMATRDRPVSGDVQPARPLVRARPKSSRQLVFLHDLKLVHPQELYTADPVLALADAGVAARFADAQMEQQAGGENRVMPYLAFMQGALKRFVDNDHKGCLDDLRFVLNQYPDDVNALFYAGLCSHNLGLHARARVLLHKAAVHPVDVFDEEAAWYHALTLEKLGERDAAQEALERIASSGGFYAEQAEARLAQ